MAPADGKEDEFSAWYDKMGAPDLRGSLGSLTMQRLILARPAGKQIPTTKYLTLFMIETSNITAGLKALAGQSSHPNPALDTNSTRAYTYRAIGAMMEGDKVRADRVSSNHLGK